MRSLDRRAGCPAVAGALLGPASTVVTPVQLPQGDDLAAEGLGEQPEGGHEQDHRDRERQQPRRRCGEDDAGDRRDDLGPEARRQRGAQPRQHRLDGQQRVPGGSDGDHPAARRTRDDDAEHEDQERVDLHVERGAEARHRAGASRHPAVDRVEDEGCGGQPGEHSDRSRSLGAVGGERGRAADEHRAPQRHPVGRSQAALPGTDEGHRQQDGAERACCEGSDPAADLEPHRCRKGRQHGDQGEHRDERLGLPSTHPVLLSQSGTVDTRVWPVRLHPPLGEEARVPDDARAFWVCGPGRGAILPAPVEAPAADEVLVRTLHSGVSRGTEALVFRGEVPADQRAVMRAPFQDGDLPGPVKYGYLNVGLVEAGPPDLLGRVVFCLYPHQTRYVVPAAAVVPVPDGVPAARAVLAGTVETAVNALWDAGPLVGDRVTVVGAGMVGCCVARLLAGIPGVDVQLVDVDPARSGVAAALGVAYRPPDDAATGRDLVLHTSATAAGLQRSLELLTPDGTVLELSWYGDRKVELSLGGVFHSSRLAVRASQVGAVAAARRGNRTTRDRLVLALDLLQDPAFDAVVTGSSPFDDLPDVMSQLADGSLPALCHRIDYEAR